MELEYRLALLIGKAATHEQLASALNCYEKSKGDLDPQSRLFLINLTELKRKTIQAQINDFNGECFAIHNDFAYINKPIEPPVMEGCGTEREPQKEI